MLQHADPFLYLYGFNMTKDRHVSTCSQLHDDLSDHSVGAIVDDDIARLELLEVLQEAQS
jgi:hypothetical protein